MMHQSSDTDTNANDNHYDRSSNESPLTKKARRSKPADDDINNELDETKNSSSSANTNDIVHLANCAWEHYRNFMDGNDDDDDDDDDEEEDKDDAGDDSSRCSHEHEPHQKVQNKEHEGDIDELLELIEILVSSSPAMKISPLLSPDSSPPIITTATTNPFLLLLSGKRNNDDGGVANCLLPILLSMSYVHLANHAVSESFMTTAASTTYNNRDDDNFGSTQSSLSPEYYFQQALHYWPTNPIAMSLRANYHRMYNFSTTSDVCDMYVKAAESAIFWRRAALEFLKKGVSVGICARGEDEERKCGEEVEMEEEGINAKEWVELLVLNGALDVDYIGKNDEDSITSTEKDYSSEFDQEEYSTSGVEATASFMSAFLLSILSKHDEALLHLQKFRLSHRIHPNVWLAAEAEATATYSKQVKGLISSHSSCTPSSSSHIFKPRIYGRDFGGTNSYSNCHGILPPELYQRLCALFAPNAPYWKESDYDHRGYYSYYIHLNNDDKNGAVSARDHPSNVIEDVIVNHLLPLAEQVLEKSASNSAESSLSPSPARIVGAEWWTHTRPLGANLGHQIHFDTDESLLERDKRVTHPIVSSVLYLTGARRENCRDGGGGAGSTIVFDQTPESTDVAPQAWISHPRDNSFLVFPGNLLHGVLPCSGTRCSKGLEESAAATDTIPHRLTFMVGFWTRNVTEGIANDRELYSPCGQLPPPSQHSWVKQSQWGYGSGDVKTETKWMNDRRCNEYEILPSVSPAWERIICSKDGCSTDSTLKIPKILDHRFFVSNAPYCFSESLYEK